MLSILIVLTSLVLAFAIFCYYLSRVIQTFNEHSIYNITYIQNVTMSVNKLYKINKQIFQLH